MGEEDKGSIMKAIWITGDITREVTTNLVAEVEVAVAAGERDIRIHMDSPGGTFGAAVECLDALKRIRAQCPGLRLSTHNTGTVSASGLIVFLAGQHRVGDALSQFGFQRVFIRPPPGVNLTNSQVNAMHRKADELMEEMYRKETGISQEEVIELFPDSTVDKDASWALQHGFIHEIMR